MSDETEYKFNIGDRVRVRPEALVDDAPDYMRNAFEVVERFADIRGVLEDKAPGSRLLSLPIELMAAIMGFSEEEAVRPFYGIDLSDYIAEDDPDATQVQGFAEANLIPADEEEEGDDNDE